MTLPLCRGFGRPFASGIERVTVEIVILAMIAAFLGLRLYSVLGKRADHGDEPLHSRFDANFDANKGGLNVAPPQPAPVQATNAPRPRDELALVPAVDRGLREISAVDRRFDVIAFVEGARGAYRMILEAFWRGDNTELAHLCEPAVAHSFAEAITARNEAGEVLDHRLVRITEVSITDASYVAPHARITLRFVADIAAVTRNAEGHAIAGSLDDAVEVRDVWTFARDTNGANHDWILEETDEG